TCKPVPGGAAGGAAIRRHDAGADAGAHAGSVPPALVPGAGAMSDASPMDVSSWSAARPAPMPLRQLLPPLLLWLVLALLAVGRIAELPLLAGAGWGVLLLFRDARALWRLPGVRLALGLFACYWLPSRLS